MYFFKYVVEFTFYDGKEIQHKTEQGITFGENYQEAIARVIKYYHEDDVTSVCLTMWNDRECMPISEKVLDNLEFDEI